MERHETAVGGTAAEQHEDLVIEREVDLGLDGDALWALVGTADGWRRWLVDEGDLAIREGEHGHVIDGGVEREVRVGTVEHGRSVTFRWWEHGDPATASEVSISIVRHADGSRGLAIVERLRGARLATTSARTIDADLDLDADARRFAWEVRACLAWASTRTTATV